MEKNSREREAGAASKTLPLLDNGSEQKSNRGSGKKPSRKLMILALVILLFATGGIVGVYFQPPGLKLFFRVTGLEPGAGTNTPIAVSPPKPSNPDAASDVTNERSVVALGRLLPLGDTITVAPPYGAGDARVEALFIEEGDRVSKGQVIATMDNTAQLEAAVENSESQVAVRLAQLEQVKSVTEASRLEAQASNKRAAASYDLASKELERGRELRGQGIITLQEIDRLEAAALEALRELERSRATLSRYVGTNDREQPDIVLAERNLGAARAELKRATADLAKARVVASTDGTVISVNARIGERPGSDGVATLGNTDTMQVELEVYQSDVADVVVGQDVFVTADAIGSPPLVGAVVKLGLEVKRQQLIANDPAANTDARVVLVTVALDPDSSARASGLTGLQVVGRIQSEVSK